MPAADHAGAQAPRPLKILATSVPLLTHMWTIVPIAWALRSRGHDVRVATLPNLTDEVVQTSLSAMPVGQVLEAGVLPEFNLFGGSPLMTVFAQANMRMGGMLAKGLLETLDHFRPDLVVHEPAELGGPLIAQRLGIPAVYQTWGPPFRPRVLRAARAGAVALRERFGMGPEPAPPALVLDVCPPGYQDSQFPIDAPRQLMRYVPYNGPGAQPAWAREQPTQPRVCITLGTVLPENGGLRLLSRLVRVLAPLGLDIVVPLRPVHAAKVDLDLPGVRVVDWLPLKLLAGSCDLVIHQGGPGTTLTMLGFGVPQLALPVFGDEHTNARLLERCGAGRKLDHRTMADQEVVEAVQRLLKEPSYRDRAAALAEEIARQPSPAQVAEVLEGLVAAW